MPTTPAGKAISSKNSFKHGLAAAQTYIPEHLRPLHDEITEDFTETLKPEGHLEEDALKLLIQDRFQMERVRILQGNLAHTPGVDPLNDPACKKDYDRLERYYKEAHSRYRANLRELRKLQTERQNRFELFVPDADFPALADMPQAFRLGQYEKRISRNELHYAVRDHLNGPMPGQPASTAVNIAR